MNIIEIIILGVVQGIAEFLPISSSAHLIIFRDIFGIGASITDSVALSFDIALHLGTLLAIVVYFFKDLLKVLIDGLTKFKEKEGKLLWYIAVATVPAGIFGVLLQDQVEEFARSNYILIALSLSIMGIIIYFIDKKSREVKDIKQVSLFDAITIGLLQVFALIPGFSRSGTTIVAGRICELKKEDAAKFSFYLSIPVVLGAVLVTFLKDDGISIVTSNVQIFIIGITTSFIVGLLTINFLLSYLKKHDFKLFMWYRIILAIVVLLALFKGI
jgi:undecaprenyl-diphosphatase